jgi:hypothetical protein
MGTLVFKGGSRHYSFRWFTHVRLLFVPRHRNISPRAIPLIPRVVIPMRIRMPLIRWVKTPFATVRIEPPGRPERRAFRMPWPPPRIGGIVPGRRWSRRRLRPSRPREWREGRDEIGNDNGRASQPKQQRWIFSSRPAVRRRQRCYSPDLYGRAVQSQRCSQACRINGLHPTDVGGLAGPTPSAEQNAAITARTSG